MTSERERLLARLAKLLAVAESSNANQHEANSAKKMSERLMVEHGITRDQVTGYIPAGYYELPMGSEGFTVTWRFALVTAAARFHGCEAVALQLGKRRKVRVVGDRDAVVKAAAMYREAVSELAKLEKDELAAVRISMVHQSYWSEDPRGYTDSFRRGVVSGLVSMMSRYRRSTSTRGKAGFRPATSATSEPFAEPVTPEWRSERLLQPLSSLSGPDPATPPQYTERIRSHYAPRRSDLNLDDASVDFAFWRGFEAAGRMDVHL